MTPEPLVASIMQYGPWLVFGNVLLQQLGLPVPVWPTLLVVGSLAAGWPQLALALVAAVGAAMVADRPDARKIRIRNTTSTNSAPPISSTSGAFHG